MYPSVFICWYVFTTLNWGQNKLVAGSRFKRVIHGLPVLDIKNTDYQVLRYFVWIGSGHNCDTPLPDFVSFIIGKPKGYEINIFGGISRLLDHTCPPRPSNLRCTGSLLTPFIVQTACHCMVYFYYRDIHSIEYPVSMKAEEEGFSVHPARRLVEEIQEAGVYAKRFVVHPKCVRLKTLVLHDYGLIVLEHSFEPYQKAYAPIYPIVDLARIWIETQAKRKICLSIGFGSFSVLDEQSYQQNIALKSDVLRHGWMEATNYGECYYRFKGGIMRNYTEMSTSFCAIQIPRTRGKFAISVGKGDSGGPITCDNEYVGLVCLNGFERQGEVLPGYGPKVGYALHMATAFTVYENSAEYRAALHNRIFELYGPDDPMKNYIVTQLPPDITVAPRSRAGSKSGLRFLLQQLAFIVVLILSKPVSM